MPCGVFPYSLAVTLNMTAGRIFRMWRLVGTSCILALFFFLAVLLQLLPLAS